MERISRQSFGRIEATLARGKSVLLLGPRQVGKTTLVEQLPTDMSITLASPAIRQQYERDIGSFTAAIEALVKRLGASPLVAVDEIQKVPDLMDAVQDLIDRKVAQFVLTGSSARKLRRHHQRNWLPGRVIVFHLDPLSMCEYDPNDQDLETLLLYGALPEVFQEKDLAFKLESLESYVVTYLEEEIRQEAIVRKIGDFARFLELAAAESGHVMNANKLSQDIGVAQTTISSYYQVLEDCLVAERIDSLFAENPGRRRLTKAPKYLLFDLGVRRMAAKEGVHLPAEYMGHLFEQFVGLNLLYETRARLPRMTLYFWRDHDGREVDWVIKVNGQYIPIEVKWTSTPKFKDLRHLTTFMADYKAKQGYVICRCAQPLQLSENIIALPWQQLLNCIPKESPS